MADVKSALVLGGLGFIGTHLAVRLAHDGWQLTVVDNADPLDSDTRQRLASLPSSVEVCHGGIQDRALMAPLLASADVVFDLAGSTGHMASMDDPQRDIADNLVFHIDYLNVIRKLDRLPTVVLASTRQVLGAHDGKSVDDHTCPRPVDVNGVSKLALEQYLRVVGAAWGLRSLVLRLPNVYGPQMRTRDARNGVIGGWIGQALNARPLQVYGTGEGRRNALYVGDAVESLIAAMSLASVAAPAFLVGGEELSLADVAASIASRAGVPLEHVPMPESQRSIDIGSVVVDDSQFRAATGWHPAVGFEEGLTRTLEFCASLRSGDG